MGIEIDGQVYSWTQPVCDECWWSMRSHRPYRFKPDGSDEGPLEVCCFCGNGTTSGIYMRVDPRHVDYPSFED